MFAKTFRNSLLASSLLIGASLLVGPAAMADGPHTDSDDITANVPVYREVGFSPSAQLSLDSDAAVSAHEVGTLYIRDNDPSGWSLQVSSANGGKFVHEDNDDEIVYTALRVDGNVGGNESASLTLSPAVGEGTENTGMLFTNAAYHTDVSDGVDNISLLVDIAEDARKGISAGDYSDTLTFTMMAND